MQVYRMKRMVILSLWAMVIGLFFMPEAHLQAAETGRYDEAKLKAIVQGYIETQMPWSRGTLRVVYPVKLDTVVVNGGRITHEVVPKLNNGFIGDALFAIRFYSRGALVREEPIRVVMELARDIIVSTRVLHKDRTIKTDDVRIEKQWFRQIPLNTVGNLDEVVGKRIGLSIRPNLTITRNMLKDPIMIKRGKVVRIILDAGAMHIAAMGLSEEDGMEGAMIRVRNMASRRVIYAKVVDETLVRVEL